MNLQQRQLWRKYVHALRSTVDDFTRDPNIERAYKEETLREIVAEINYWLEDRPQLTERELEDLLD